jgi:hypothetical protein
MKEKAKRFKNHILSEPLTGHLRRAQSQMIVGIEIRRAQLEAKAWLFQCFRLPRIPPPRSPRIAAD